jgi:hypothetical protein
MDATLFKMGTPDNIPLKIKTKIHSTKRREKVFAKTARIRSQTDKNIPITPLPTISTL